MTYLFARARKAWYELLLVALALLVTACASASEEAARAEITQVERQQPYVVASTRNELAKLLEERYGEKPAWRSLGTDFTIFEIFESPEGETWTLVQSLPNGESRVLAAGFASSFLGSQPQGELTGW